ncbi:MAG: isoprenylcysteine carboxylmethyltransferase family protein [Planctomycetes bacterium]|nr:isoprenylcysteine carboxylmethyltransferase family protein [Planctomycetota bacterium]
MVQRTRLYTTRIFVAALLVLLFIGGSEWEKKCPIVSSILFLIGCFLAGIASLGRLWCSVYIAGYKTKNLIVQGPYSICRNPLYFFSMLGGIGVGLASETLTIPAILIVAFAFYYPFVIRYEEQNLRNQFGQIYDDYVRRTPQFWPKWSLLNEPQEYTFNPKVFKKHLFSTLWFVWMIGILELIEELHDLQLVPEYFYFY